MIIRDDQGNVIKDLTQSPCYEEIGYNPRMPRQTILDEYDYCEWQKTKQTISTVLFVLLIVGLAGLFVRLFMKWGNPFKA